MEISAEELMKIISAGGASAPSDSESEMDTEDETKEESLLTDLATAVFNLAQKVDKLLAEDEQEMFAGGLGAGSSASKSSIFTYDGSVAPVTYNSPVTYGGM